MAVKITGNTIRIVGKLKKNLSPANKTKFFGKAVNYQVLSTKQNFAKETDPDGNKWKALDARTLKRKRSGKILRETSRLINSIVPIVTSQKGIVQTLAAYGIYHQTGTRKMDARVFLGISEKDTKKITNIAQKIFFDDI